MSNKKNLSEEDAVEKNDEEGQTQTKTTDNPLEGESLKKTNNMLGVHTKPLKLVHSTSETNKITGSSDNQTKRQESNILELLRSRSSASKSESISRSKKMYRNRKLATTNSETKSSVRKALFAKL